MAMVEVQTVTTLLEMDGSEMVMVVDMAGLEWTPMRCLEMA